MPPSPQKESCQPHIKNDKVSAASVVSAGTGKTHVEKVLYDVPPPTQSQSELSLMPRALFGKMRATTL